MIIFEQLARVMEEATASGVSCVHLARLFNRNRKAIYSYKNGCGFRCDLDFVMGLQSLGYDIQIIKKRGRGHD